MRVDGKEIKLMIAGMGIIFYSPQSVAHIPEGSDYFESNYSTDDQVQPHIQSGTIVGFGTGSPGVFILKFHSGYPTEDVLHTSTYKLQLGLRCIGGVVCFNDLFDLIKWEAYCPENQQLELEDGVYDVILCSDLPPGGDIGDDQVIAFYLQKLDAFPRLAKEGIPHLIQ